MKTPLLDKIAGKIPGEPDTTGPYGRGAGPGGGRADGSGYAHDIRLLKDILGRSGIRGNLIE